MRNGLEPSPMPAQMTVNQKGNVGVIKIAADLISRGYEVYLPLSGASAVDLVVADNKQRLRRLQVKYRSPDQRGYVAIKLCSIVNGRTIPIDTSKIDGWAVYCPDRDSVYYVPKALIRKKQFTISLVPTNARGVLLSDSLKDPWSLWKETRGPPQRFRSGVIAAIGAIPPIPAKDRSDA